MTKPLVTLERNNAGRMFVGLTEFRDGIAVRACVLSMADEHTADTVMARRYGDLVRLMGDNVDAEDRTR